LAVGTAVAVEAVAPLEGYYEDRDRGYDGSRLILSHAVLGRV